MQTMDLDNIRLYNEQMIGDAETIQPTRLYKVRIMEFKDQPLAQRAILSLDQAVFCLTLLLSLNLPMEIVK